MKKFLTITGLVLLFSACSNPFFPGNPNENEKDPISTITDVADMDKDMAVEDDVIFIGHPESVSLSVKISPVIVYNNSSAALTPLEAVINNTPYTEHTAMVTVEVSGFLQKGDADSIGLAIVSDAGLTCGETMAAYDMSGSVKIFTFMVTYNGAASFDSGKGTVTVTGLTGVSDNYHYDGGDKTINVVIRDEQENWY